MLNALAFLIFSFTLTLFGVELWRRLALRRQHLDIPNERSSHTRPTPRGGGIVMFFVTIGFLLFFAWQDGKLRTIFPFLVGAGLIAIISYLDDLFNLPSPLRFAVHLTGALLAIFSLGFFGQISLPFFGVLEFNPLVGQILTALWIVGLTNAYNFMDGIDGIAGTQGFVAGVGWCVIGFFTGNQLICVFGALIAATSAGFLWHNWSPARIFMGDVGSAFLGYSLAVMPLFIVQKSENSALLPIIGALLVWTFVFDAAFTFLRRLLRGENVFSAHRSHLYQRLVIKGFRHDAVTVYYGVLATIGVLLAIYLIKQPEQFSAILIFPFLCLLLWFSVSLSEKKFYVKRA
jgi:UDP-N-acetylmuramyl pentapeptide phosphotransferase/UDP-N-acetylglucosamine-1-phosphate transferase